jgi:hypothetical protein
VLARLPAHGFSTKRLIVNSTFCFMSEVMSSFDIVAMTVEGLQIVECIFSTLLD